MVYDFIVFILCNLAVLLTAFALEKRFFKGSNIVEKLFVIGFSYLAIILLMLLIAGTIGLLFSSYIIMFCLFFLGVFLVGEFRSSLKGAHKFLFEPSGISKGVRLPSKWLAISLLLLGFVIYIRIFWAATLPPWEADSIGYHLPNSLYYYLHGNIYSCLRLPLSIHNISLPWSIFYPGNSELLYVWPFVTKGVSLLNFPSFLIYALVATSMWLLGVHIFHVREANILNLLLCSSTSILIGQLATQQNDVLFALFFLASFLFLIKHQKTSSVRWLVFSGLSCGLMVGTKYSGFYYFLILSIVYWILRAKISWKSGFVFLLFVLVSLGSGLPWYLRNLLMVKNPFYPEHIGILGWTIFEGPQHLQDTSIAATFFHRELWVMVSRIFSHLLLGAGFIPFLSLLGLFGLLKYRKMEPTRRAFYMCALFAWVLYFLTPLTAEVIPGSLDQFRNGDSLRYGLIAILIGAPLGIRLLYTYFKRNQVYTIVIIGFFTNLAFGSKQFLLPLFISRGFANRISLAQMGSLGIFVAIQVLLFVSFVFLFLKLYRVFNVKRILFSASIVILVILSMLSSLRGSRDGLYDNLVNRYAQLPTKVFDYVDGNIKNSSVLAYSDMLYPFFGEAFDNEVWSIGDINSNETLTSVTRSLSVDFIILTKTYNKALPQFGQFPDVRKVIKSDTSRFNQKYSDTYGEIYSVERSNLYRMGK
jgi:hypothetical protein